MDFLFPALIVQSMPECLGVRPTEGKKTCLEGNCGKLQQKTYSSTSEDLKRTQVNNEEGIICGKSPYLAADANYIQQQGVHQAITDGLESR